MTLEQLKQRIEATCNKNGIFPTQLSVLNLIDQVSCRFEVDRDSVRIDMPNVQLTLEAVDLECRAIKARQSSATNGIDE